jgi:hypothetical protein
MEMGSLRKKQRLQCQISDIDAEMKQMTINVESRWDADCQFRG